MADNVIKIIFY